MARAPSEKIIKAKELFDKGYKLIDIAKELDIPEGTIRSWKNRNKWGKDNNATLQNNECNVANKKGGQRNNKNSVGHGAPKKNKNAETHGFFSKFLPEDTFNIIQEMDEDPSKILWQNIQIQYAAIVRAENIMLVESNGDTSSSERYTIQFAWDKQALFLKAQSRAMAELRLLIKQFEVTASEEQKLKIQKMKAELNKISSGDGAKEDGEIKDMLEGIKNGL